jgi:hypothetical protein
MNIQDRIIDFLLLSFLLLGCCKGTSSNLSTLENSTQEFQTKVEILKGRNKKGPNRSKSFAGITTNWEWPQENEKNFKTVRHLERKAPTFRVDFDTRVSALKPIDEDSTEDESSISKAKSSDGDFISSSNFTRFPISGANNRPLNEFGTKSEKKSFTQSTAESRYADRLEFYNDFSRSQSNVPQTISTYTSIRKYQSTGPLAREIRGNLKEKTITDSKMDIDTFKKLVSTESNERIQPVLRFQNSEPPKKLNFIPELNDKIKPPAHPAKPEESKKSETVPKSKVEGPGSIDLNQSTNSFTITTRT